MSMKKEKQKLEPKISEPGNHENMIKKWHTSKQQEKINPTKEADQHTFYDFTDETAGYSTPDTSSANSTAIPKATKAIKKNTRAAQKTTEPLHSLIPDILPPPTYYSDSALINAVSGSKMSKPWQTKAIDVHFSSQAVAQRFFTQIQSQSMNTSGQSQPSKSTEEPTTDMPVKPTDHTFSK